MKQAVDSGAQCSITCALDLKSTMLPVVVAGSHGVSGRRHGHGRGHVATGTAGSVVGCGDGGQVQSRRRGAPTGSGSELLLVPQLPVCYASLALAKEPAIVWRIFVKQMSQDMFTLHVAPNDTILDIKMRIADLNSAFAVHLQVYSVYELVPDCDDCATRSLDDDERTLASYNLQSGSTICMVVLDAYVGGAFLREFETGRGLCEPHAMSVSSGGHICVCDESAERVLLFDKYGQLIRTFPLDNWKLPTCAAILTSSDDGDRSILAIADVLNNCVKILNLETGAVIQTFGSHGAAQGHLIAPFGVCLLRRRWIDNLELEKGGFFTTRALLVADTMNHRVQEFHLGNSDVPICTNTFGRQGSGAGEFQMPSGVLLMARGKCGEEETVVADTANNRLQVFDGKRQHRLILTRAGARQLERPRHLCVSPDYAYLFVGEPRSVAVFAHDRGVYKFRHSIAVVTGVCGIGLNESGSELFVLSHASPGRILIFSVETACE